ncbi:MAG: protein kinase [Deltaproteobacteria bacterium]|nr:protein kinase [Deltaproteobacteria bacterium]
MSDAPVPGGRPETPPTPTPTPSTDPFLDRVIAGRYRLDRLIGHGGMGVVYSAEQVSLPTSFSREVVVKVMRQEASLLPEATRRFENEARVVAALNHPHIVTVHDFGREDDGLYYLVMERLVGRTLHEVIRKSPLSWPVATEVMRQIALALQAAHARDIVHRDLKPANVFLVDDPGGRTVVKVLDFGLARRLDVDDTASKSNPLGTHAYMSPEQLDGRGARAWSDCYAAGIVWYELLTGTNPFRAESLSDTLNRHIDLTPSSPSSLVPAIPADVDALVLRLLSKDPARRPDARSLLDELDLVLADAGAVAAAAPPDATRRVVRPTRASPRRLRVTNAVLSVGLLVGVVGLLLAFPAPTTTTTTTTSLPMSIEHKSLAGLPPPPVFDATVVDLGRRLFFETRLSSNDQVSCDTCHPVDRGGTTFEARTQLGVTHNRLGWNTPTIFNAAHVYHQTWLAEDVDIEQVMDRPLTRADLMGMKDWPAILQKLAEVHYAPRFTTAGLALDEAGVKRAIATYVRFIEPRRSPFDRFTEGEPLNSDAARGHVLFNEFGCVGCHQGRGIGGNMVARLGAVADAYADRGLCDDGSHCRSDEGCKVLGGGLCREPGNTAEGKGGWVRPKIDDGIDGTRMFRVPSLRNVGVTAPYFHDGSARTLEEAVRTMAKLQLGRSLDDADVSAIVAFLHSLTGVVNREELTLAENLRIELR